MDVTLADPLVGAVLEGRYRIRGRIARGGMATVYDALDERLERTVAVKVMHPAYASDPQFIGRFIGEAKASARLSHPNIVAVYDQGSHDDLAFLVMEQVQGRTLRDLLTERGRLTIPEAVTVMSAILDGLAAAHRIGLVHRDVKPENVLIGIDGAIKVADFGLARAVESVHITNTGNTVMGTVAYVSPEQIVTGNADPRSDVYSAGITFFEMLTGTVPFGGESAVSIAFQHVNSAVPPASTRAGVPPALDALVLRATNREPAARPLDAGAFFAELQHVRADLGVPHTIVAAPEQDRTAVQRMQPLAASSQTTRPVPMAGPPGGRQPVGRAPYGPPQRRGPRTGLIAIAILIVLGLVAAGTGWYFGAGRYTNAPSLVTLSQKQAQQKAASNGLTIGLAQSQYSETVPKGRVIRQDPGPNGRILGGGQITLVLSLGPQRFPVPDLIGLNQDDAQKALAAASLRVAVRTQFSNTVSNGTVISSDPPKNTPLTAGSVVTLVISQGAKPVDVPDLRGRSQAEAEAILKDRGLRSDVTLQDTGNGEDAGRVIGQDPAEGTATSGSVIKLTVGAGSAQVEVPDLLGLNRGEVERALQQRGLELRRIGGGKRAFLQIPTASSRVDAGTRVTVWFAG